MACLFPIHFCELHCTLSVATRQIIDFVPFFKKYTDKERDILGKNSSNLFTLNNIYKATQKILHTDICKQDDVDFLIKYWRCVSENIQEWQDLLHRSITKKDIRENYIITLAITINAIGRLGRYFYDNPQIEMAEYLTRLRDIDWLRSNQENWLRRTIRENGRVMNNEEAVALTCSKIKHLIGLPLSKEEQAKEIGFQRGINKYV